MKRVSHVVLYHGNCSDGVFAALVMKIAYEGVVCVPHYTTVALDLTLLADKKVTLFLLDYCGPNAEFLLKACALFDKVILIDHHKTAFEMVESLGLARPDNFETHMRNDMSGCMLAQQYANIQLAHYLEQVLRYVQDNDLWLHKLPNSKEFTAGLQSLKLDYDFGKNPLLLNQLLDVTVDKCVALGKEELARQAVLIAKRLEAREWIIFKGDVKVLATHIEDSDYGITSQLGHELAVLNGCTGIGAVIREHDTDPEIVCISLRGRDESVDTTILSTSYGGGGHRGASGFKMSLTELDNIAQPGNK